MKSSSHIEDSTTFAYPRPLSSIAASVCGLAVFLIIASLLLLSQPIGSAVRGYFYGVDHLGESTVDYLSNMTIPYLNDDKQNFAKSGPIQKMVDGNKTVSTNGEPESLIIHGQNVAVAQHDSGTKNVVENNPTSRSEDPNDLILQQKDNNMSSPGPLVISGTNGVKIDSPKSQDSLNSSNLAEMDQVEPPLTPTAVENNESNVNTGCDLYHGKWVHDSLGPLYTNNTCPVLTQTQNCQGNGRPDKDYENWRWKPSKCDLPRFNGKKFLELMRGKTLAFIGDSVARNQMESMLCMLWQVEVPKNRGNKRMQRYYFRSTSTMIVRVWSSWLVHQTSEAFENVPSGMVKLHLDKPDQGFMDHISTFDVMVLSSGHWFAKRSVYMLNNEIVGGQLWWPDKSRPMKVNNVDAFGISVETILSAIVGHPNYTGLTIVRSFSPDHYEGGAWNTGGSCTGKVNPILDGKLVENGFTNIMHKKQVEGFNHVIKKMKNRSILKLMDITEVFSYRHDGHPGPYRSLDPNKVTKRGPDGRPPPQDCLHWCMPGPVDTWNELVLEIIRREFEDSRSSKS